MSKLLVLLFLMVWQFCVEGQFEHKKLEAFPIETIMKKGDCSIAFVTEKATNERYVIKQINDPKPDEQFLLVIDATACRLAQELKIPMNFVEIYPPYSALAAMMQRTLPATLHTYVSGEALDCLPYVTIDIHQRRLRKDGTLEKAECCLTSKVLTSMATHPQLPRIVAFDTFVGNADRSLPNIFYDPITDCYCGIDLSASWCTLLGGYACERLRELERQGYQFTQSEKQALKIYVETLEMLMDTFPPERVSVLLEEYAEKAGFTAGSVLYDQDVKERILFHKRMIKKNYRDCSELVTLLRKMGF